MLQRSSQLRWTYSPVNPIQFHQSRPRVFIIGAEPIGGRPHPASVDMGDWFRLARRKNYWDNPSFYRAILLRLRAVLGLQASDQSYAEQDLSILKHMRYIDLKATEGTGAIPDPPVDVQNYVLDNIDQITGYWKSDTPEITVLLGWAAQRVFERIVNPELVKANLRHLKRLGLSHPSQYWHDLGGLTGTTAKLSSLSEKLNRWAPNARRWMTGIP